MIPQQTSKMYRLLGKGIKQPSWIKSKDSIQPEKRCTIHDVTCGRWLLLPMFEGGENPAPNHAERNLNPHSWRFSQQIKIC